VNDTSDNWSEGEVEAAVDAYADLYERAAKGEAINKRALYRALSTQHGRTANAYERRFMNISYVLVGMGLPFLPGLKPARNVGTTAALTIQSIVETKGYFSSALAAPTADPELLEKRTRALVRRGVAGVPAGKSQPARVSSTVERIVRDPAVKAWVLKAAAGHCENCGLPAPFVQEDGTPFLEVHHIKWLAQGGSDTVTNAAALCPNCHRRFHHGADALLLAGTILGKVARLIAE
jgi:5-methylcytosine-specific restriction protein A